MNNNPFMETFMPSIKARQNAPSEELFYQIQDLKSKLKRSYLSPDDKIAAYAYLDGLRDIEKAVLAYNSRPLANGFYADSFSKLANLSTAVNTSSY